MSSSQRARVVSHTATVGPGKSGSAKALTAIAVMKGMCSPRSATVATTRPTTLLVLYASDFYEIASHIPKLAEAVEIEAKRRREENLERQAGGARR